MQMVKDHEGDSTLAGNQTFMRTAESLKIRLSVIIF